jgi:hypothetical protein
MKGTVLQGYRLASGMTKQKPYLPGTLVMQPPYFWNGAWSASLLSEHAAHGDLPYPFPVVNPEITLEQVA